MAYDLNPFSPNFKLSACDGPDLSSLPNGTSIQFNGKTVKTVFGKNPEGYVPCNFEGLMLQGQVLINAMIVLGVVAALLSFTYAGWLLVTGGPDKKNDAKKIFKNVGIGFIMMLTAWFIVYQLLSWLVANPGVKALLTP